MGVVTLGWDPRIIMVKKSNYFHNSEILICYQRPIKLGRYFTITLIRKEETWSLPMKMLYVHHLMIFLQRALCCLPIRNLIHVLYIKMRGRSSTIEVFTLRM